MPNMALSKTRQGLTIRSFCFFQNQGLPIGASQGKILVQLIVQLSCLCSTGEEYEDGKLGTSMDNSLR
jgi:hypothetical protein